MRFVRLIAEFVCESVSGQTMQQNSDLFVGQSVSICATEHDEQNVQ